MSSRREQAIAGVIEALNLGRPSDIPEAHRERLAPFGAGAQPAINVKIPDLGGKPQETVTAAGGRRPVVQRLLTVAVECYTVGDTSDLDPLLIWVTSVLVGTTLGGIVESVEEIGTVWQDHAADQNYRKATMLLAVKFQTAATNQEARA